MCTNKQIAKQTTRDEGLLIKYVPDQLYISLTNVKPLYMKMKVQRPHDMCS